MYESMLGAITRHNELLEQQNSLNTLVLHQLGALMSAVSDLRDKVAEVALNVRDKITALEAAVAASQQAANDALAAAGVAQSERDAVQAQFDATNAELAEVTTAVDAIDEFAPPA